MSAGTLIFLVVLSGLVLLVSYIARRVNVAFRNLTESRIEVYLGHYSQLQRKMGELRENKAPPNLSSLQSPQLDLIASIPVLRLSGEAIDALVLLARKRLDGAVPAEISAAIQKAEKTLIDLHLAMREDLALTTGIARFPNAEVFRRNRNSRN